MEGPSFFRQYGERQDVRAGHHRHEGGNVAMIMAMESILRSGINLQGDVIFQSVIEEESGGAGTLAAVLRGHTADAAIIPEPTNLKLFIKQQGSMWFRVTIEGTSAHGGTRYEGVSAIEKAWIAHQMILDLERERNARITDPMYEKLPIPLPINVGTIHGGTWPSSVPDLVTIEGRIGVGPEETIEEVKEELAESIRGLSNRDEWFADHPAKLEFFGAQWIPNSVPVEHQIAGLVAENFEELFGESVTVEASPWGTDAGILGTVGGIPAIVIGPGETSVAHYPNEYIELSKVIRVAKLFALTILKWCGTV
ncbi:MAG: peptidase [Saprospiraceae bacterium]